MVALDEVVKTWKLFILVVWSILSSITSPVRVPEGVHAIFMADDPVVHHLCVVTDGQRVGIVHRSTLTDEEVPFFDPELL